MFGLKNRRINTAQSSSTSFEGRPEGKLLRYSLITIIAFAVVGCASSSGILPAGPNTYIVTERFAPIRGGSTEAQRTALTEANGFCAQQGRQFLPTDLETPASRNPYGPTDYAVTFQCLSPGDPTLARGGKTRAPDQIIESRTR
jgi:hypothetical protein